MAASMGQGVHPMDIGVEEQGDFIEVKRKSKRARPGSLDIETLNCEDTDTEYVEALPETVLQDLKVLIVPIDRQKSLISINPMVIAKTLEKCVGNTHLKHVKHVRNGILVICQNIKQYNDLKRIDEIGSTPVKIKEKVNYTKGIIHGVSIELQEEDILNSLGKDRVVKVERLKKKNGKGGENVDGKEKKEEPLRSVVLYFDSSTLPDSVSIYYERFRVKQFIPNVARCFKCQRYGHVAAACRGKERCVRCGGEHPFDQCPKTQLYCVNCKGAHSAAYGGCTALKQAKEIQKCKVHEKISYAQAVKVVKEKSQSGSGAESIPTKSQDKAPVNVNRERDMHNTESNAPQQSVQKNKEEVVGKRNEAHMNGGLVNNTTVETEITKLLDEPGTKVKSQDVSKNFMANATNEAIIAFLIHILVLLKETKEIPIMVKKICETAQMIFGIHFPDVSMQIVNGLLL